MRLNLSLLFISTITLISAQTEFPEPATLPRLERSFGLGAEDGTGFEYADDRFPDIGTTFDNSESKGISLFYEQQLNDKKGWGYSAGFGGNVTFFSFQLYRHNIRESIMDMYGADSISATPVVNATHKFGMLNNLFIAMDFPFTLSYSFQVRPGFFLRPYVGLKARTVVIIPNSNRNVGYNLGGTEGPDSSYTFQGRVPVKYSTYNSSIMLLGTVGIKGTHLFKKGGGISVFADYNLAVFNHFEVALIGLQSTEKAVVHNYYTSAQEVKDFTFKSYPVYLALKMSHFRIGVSYSLPSRKDR
jgi:hypothetical protein